MYLNTQFPCEIWIIDSDSYKFHRSLLTNLRDQRCCLLSSAQNCLNFKIILISWLDNGELRENFSRISSSISRDLFIAGHIGRKTRMKINNPIRAEKATWAGDFFWNLLRIILSIIENVWTWLNFHFRTFANFPPFNFWIWFLDFISS